MVNAGDILTLSTNSKYADCGDKDTIYVDYVNITNLKVNVTILSQLLILISVLGLIGWLTGIC